MNTFFRGLFDTDMTNVISISDFLLCIGFDTGSGWSLFPDGISNNDNAGGGAYDVSGNASR